MISKGLSSYKTQRVLWYLAVTFTVHREGLEGGGVGDWCGEKGGFFPPTKD